MSPGLLCLVFADSIALGLSAVGPVHWTNSEGKVDRAKVDSKRVIRASHHRVFRGRGGAGPRHSLVAWLLISGFLLQPVLAYLVTPIFVHDGKGQQVVVCTLKGSKLITLELPPITDNDGTEHCSALKLYQFAGTTQVATPPAVPVVSLYAVQLLEQTAAHQHHSLYFSAYSSRAPPQHS